MYGGIALSRGPGKTGTGLDVLALQRSFLVRCVSFLQHHQIEAILMNKQKYLRHIAMELLLVASRSNFHVPSILTPSFFVTL
jgi:hypothetical protein